MSDEGGDPACWLQNVCPECGFLVEGRLPETCPRCGAPLVENGPPEIPGTSER
jgi:rubrerythrin